MEGESLYWSAEARKLQRAALFFLAVEEEKAKSGPGSCTETQSLKVVCQIVKEGKNLWAGD
jgi:hypothetical protein